MKKLKFLHMLILSLFINSSALATPWYHEFPFFKDNTTNQISAGSITNTADWTTEKKRNKPKEHSKLNTALWILLYVWVDSGVHPINLNVVSASFVKAKEEIVRIAFTSDSQSVGAESEVEP